MSCAGEWQTQLSRQQIKALRRRKKEEGGEGGEREATTNLTSPEGTQGETETKGESEGELFVAMETYSTTCLIIIMNRFGGKGGRVGGTRNTTVSRLQSRSLNLAMVP